MFGYLVYSVVSDRYDKNKEFKDYDYCDDEVYEYFSKKKVKKNEVVDGYTAVEVLKVKSKEDIARSLFEHGYDGEFIEYFLQRDVPYSMK